MNNKITKTRIIKSVLLATTVVAIGGCAAYDNMLYPEQDPYNVAMTGKSYPATKPNQVELIYSDQPNAAKSPCDKYDTIGKVDVQLYDRKGSPLSLNEVAANFRAAGAQYGGDAVINIQGGGSALVGTESGYIIHCS